MPRDHDPAGCKLTACLRCDDYSTGYSLGKDKLASELLTRLDDAAHATVCGCRPCTLIRAVRGRLRSKTPLWVGPAMPESPGRRRRRP